MRKGLAMAAIGFSLIGATTLTALPAMAQTTANDQSSSGNSATTPDQLLSSATKAVQDMKANSHYADLMSKCKGMFIVPDLVKGALASAAAVARGFW